MIYYEKQKEERIKKIEQSLKNLWDTMMYTNIHTIYTRRKREKSEENVFEK